MKYSINYLSLIFLLFASCSSGGRSDDGKSGRDSLSRPEVFVLRNAAGMQARFCSNGARLMSLLVPDKDGNMLDVVAGFDDPLAYDAATEPYFGATIGRYGNRIAKGKFSLDGKSYQLTINNGVNTLHGGKTGFQYQHWDLVKLGDSALSCSLLSADGDNGFPGMLSVKVVYTLTAAGELLMDYSASTDKPTVLNLTNHAFFNLNGSGSILDHSLMINASRYTPVDSTLIPTGELAELKGTPFDFRISERIGSRINSDNEQLRFGKGYDHNYVLNKSKMMPAAVVSGDKSGIVMSIYTTEPGLQFYSGNFMKGQNELRTGPDDFRTAFALETQHFPDSPNRAGFPSTVLRPGEVYHSRSVYAFSIAR